MRGVSIIIPTYNGKELLRKHLPAVLEACRAYPGESEVILVDDGGTDDTPGFAAGFPAVRVVRRSVNGGFARAANDGVRAAAYPLVFLLNNDIQVSPGVLEKLEAGFSGNDVFAVQANIISGSGAPSVSPGRVSYRFGILKYEYREEAARDLPGPAGFASAGAAMYSRDKLLAIGIFDEEFSPFYFEDIDLSLRAARLNWKIFCHPSAEVLHLHAGSTVKANYSAFRYKFIHRRNYFRLLLRHSRPVSLPLLPLYAVYRAFTGGLPELFGFFCALWLSAAGLFRRHAPLRENILYIDTPLPQPGGGQISLLNIVRNIRTRRPFVALSGESALTKQLAAAGVPHLLVRPSKLNFPGFMLNALSVLRLVRPAVVHCNSGTSFFAFVFALLARARGIPFLWHNRVLETAGLRERLMARLASRVIVISRAVGEKFRWLPAAKVVRVHNAVDLSDFAPRPGNGELRAGLGLPPGLPVAGIFSRMDGWKGHGLFIAAARKVLQSGLDCCFLFVGDGPERARVEELARGADCPGRMVFAGHRGDIPDLMNLCDVIANPSIEPEPFGRTIIEAMACGKPVVATAMGGPLEIIDNGKDGLLVRPDADELADALKKLLGDAGHAAMIGAAARKKASGSFDLRVQLAALEGLYGEAAPL